MQGFYHSPILTAEKGRRGCLLDTAIAYPGHHDLVSRTRALPEAICALVLEAGSDDTGDHLVELSDRGMDGECKISLAILVSEEDQM
jgi:hypothetical protein